MDPDWIQSRCTRHQFTIKDPTYNQFSEPVFLVRHERDVEMGSKLAFRAAELHLLAKK